MKATLQPKYLVGEVRERLGEIPDRSIQCVVTSPPYWGLRDYSIEPTVWGGEPGCRHQWGHQVVTDTRGTQKGKATTVDARESSRGQFCQLCGAWRGQLGLEPTPELFVQHLVEVFREVRRVLRDDGTVFLNLGDSYASQPAGNRVPSGFSQTRPSRRKHGTGPETVDLPAKDFANLKPKDLVGIPWRVAFALQADGWWLRSDIIWDKPNPMPESVTDRPTKSHEYIFLLTKSKRYFYDADAIREPVVEYEAKRRRREAENGIDHSFRLKVEGQPHAPSDKSTLNSISVRADFASRGRHARSVWTIATQPYKEAHFAVFPEKLAEKCILAGTSPKACPTCGAPWARVVDKRRVPDRPGRVQGCDDHKLRGAHGDDGRNGTRYGLDTKTLGWFPTCACPIIIYCSKCLSVLSSNHEMSDYDLQRPRKEETIQTAVVSEEQRTPSPRERRLDGRTTRGVEGKKEGTLQEGKREDIGKQKNNSDGLPRVREGVQSLLGSEQKTEILQHGMCEQIQRKETSQTTGGEAKDEGGLYICESPESPSRKKHGLGLRTQISDGTGTGPLFRTKGEGASPQSKQGRQQAGELRTGGNGASFGGNKMPPLSPDILHKMRCPVCNSTTSLKIEGNDGSGLCVVLDPFAGRGTVLKVARENGRASIGIDINPEYRELADKYLNLSLAQLESFCTEKAP